MGSYRHLTLDKGSNLANENFKKDKNKCILLIKTLGLQVWNIEFSDNSSNKKSQTRKFENIIIMKYC